MKYESLKNKVDKLWEQKEHQDAFLTVEDELGEDKVKKSLAKNRLDTFDNVVTKLLKRLRKQVNSLNEHNNKVDKAENIALAISSVNIALQMGNVPIFDISNGYIHAKTINKHQLHDIINRT